MEWLRYVFLALPFAIAATAAIALIFWLFSAGKVSRLVSSDFQLAIVFSVMVVGAAIQVAASGRVLTIDPDLVSESMRETGSAYVWSGRFVTLVILTIALAHVVRWAGRTLRMGAATPLWLAAMAMVLFGSVFNAIFGSEPAFAYQSLYVPIALTGIALMQSGDATRWARVLKWCIFASIVAGIAVAPVMLDQVVERGYRASVVGFPYRLHGLTAHANSLGLLAVLLGVLEVLAPSRGIRRWLVFAVALAALVGSQSKTQWISAVVVAGILTMRLFMKGPHRESTDRKDSFGTLTSLLAALAFLLSAVICILVFTKLGDRVLDVATNRALGLMTFTGRTYIWDITLDEWRRNPLFGYGPTIWSIEFRSRYGLLNVGQAHNQFVQSLGEAGLFGMLSMTVYLLVLGTYAWRSRHVTGFVSVALFALLLIRCFAEAPFRVSSLLDAGVLTHVVLFALCCMGARRGEGLAPVKVDALPSAATVRA